MIHSLHRVFVRELRRVRDHKIYLASLTLLPMFAIVIFVALFSRGTPHKLAITVVDKDHSSLSRKVVDMIRSTPEVDICFMPSSEHEGQQLIRQGKAYAMVVIPDNFEKDVLGLNPTLIAAYISGTNILTNGLISKGLLSAISSHSLYLSLKLYHNPALDAILWE